MAQILGKGLFKVMPWSMAAFLLLALTIGTWQVMPAGIAKAGDNYTVAGGNPASLPTVGAASVALGMLTMTDTGGDDFLNGSPGEVFTVTINTASYPSVNFDQTVVFGDLTVDGTCLQNSASALTFTNATTAVVTTTGGLTEVACTTGQTIRITGLKIKTVYAAVAPVAAALVKVDNTTTTSGTTVATSDTVALAITAADPNASITVSNPVTGATGTVILNITLPVDLAVNDTIEFDVPAYINIAGGVVSEDSFAGAGSFGQTIATQNLKLTVSGGTVTAGTGTITLTGITGRYAGTTNVSNLEMESLGTGANDIALDTTVGVTDIIAGVANASIVFSASVVSNTAVTTTVTFALPTDLVGGDTVEITFPAYVNVAGASFTSESFPGASTFHDCTPSSQKIICLANGEILKGLTGGVGEIVLAGIKFYYAGTDDITVFEVQDQGNDLKIIAADITTSLTNVTAADAAATVVLLNNTVPSRIGTTTITLSVPFAIDADDEVVITFPPFIDITGGAETAGGTFKGTGTISCDDASQDLICVLSGGTSLTTGTITLANITTSYAGVTDISSFVVLDESGSDKIIAGDSDVALTNTTLGSSSGSGSSGSTAPSTEAVVTITDLVDQTGGDTATITWSTAGNGIDTVELGYSINGGSTYTQIAYNVSKSLGTYSWSVPNIDASDVLVKITAYDTGKANLDTDVTAAFDITANSEAAAEDDEAVTEILDNTELDSEGRMIANNSGENGLSPVTGLAQEISEVREGWFIRSNYFNTVYFIDEAGRHPFWDANSFFSYTDSFDIVIWVTDATLPTLPLASPILPQPGTVLVKIQSDAKTYAIEDGNVLRWVPSEATAEALYGEDWADYIIDLEPTVFARFTVGDNMTSNDTVDTSNMITRVDLAERAQ